MKLLLLTFIITCPILLFGQTKNDTIYYTAKWMRTTYMKVVAIYGIKDYDENGEGLATYYWKDGTLHSHQMEKNDLKNGKCVWYHKNGQESTIARYENDTLHGEMQNYDKDGNLLETGIYENGISLSRIEYNPETGEAEDVVDYVENPEVDASFVGGTTALMQYVQQNIQYPQEAIDKDDQGKVYIAFMVDTDGSISNVKVERGVSKELDQEGKRLIEGMPNWTPAQVNGKDVKTVCRLPIVFVLEGRGSRRSKKRRR